MLSFQTNQYCGKSFDVGGAFLLARLEPVAGTVIAALVLLLISAAWLWLKKKD